MQGPGQECKTGVAAASGQAESGGKERERQAGERGSGSLSGESAREQRVQERAERICPKRKGKENEEKKRTLTVFAGCS